MIIDFNGNGGGGGGGSYTLPKASSTTLGGVKIGDNIAIASDGKISSPTYKYIIPPSGKVSDEFLAALQACGYDGVKLNELGRSVALQVALRNEGEYNYFPATEVHRYTKDSGWESDRVVFICVGMGFDAVGVVKYPIVMVEGDNAGEVGAYVGDFKMESVSIPAKSLYVIDGDSLTDEMKTSIDEMWTRLNSYDNQFTVTAKYDYTYYPAGFPVKYEYTESTPDTPTEYLHQYGVKFWSTKLNENDTAEKKVVKIFHYEGRDGDGYSVEISTSW